MSLEIRIAAATDAFAACNVLRRSISECCVLDHHNDPAILDAWLGNKTPVMVASWFASPTNFCLVALNDDVVIGVALLTQAGKVALCYLVPEACGHGAGTALLKRLEEQARTWDIKTLQLHSTASAERFYETQGYIRSGKVKSPYGVDTVFFWKQLTPDASSDATPKRKRFCSCNNA